MDSIENDKIAIITVLGRKDDDVYSQRICHVIKLARDYIELFDSIHLIVKWYKDSKWSYPKIKELVKELNCKKIVLHKDKETEYYRYGKFSFDTIEEAAMLKISIEKLFKNKKVYLTVVTSEVHSKRSDYIFRSLYDNFEREKNITSVIIPYNPSENLTYVNYSDNSATENNEEREIEENKFSNLLKKSKDKKYKDFLEYYKDRKISTKEGECDYDPSGKTELLKYIE